MSTRTFVLYFSGKDLNEVAMKDRIQSSLEREGIRIFPFDINQTYSLYGNEFSYEPSFVMDFCENGYVHEISTPVLRVGKELLVGEENITDHIPLLISSTRD